MRRIATYIFRTALILITLAQWTSCSPDTDKSVLTQVSYYTCGDETVIRIEVNNGMLLTSLFRSKELIASRQLKLDADKEGRFYHADDMSLRYDGQFIELNFQDLLYSGCTESPEELERRELAETLYFITDGGDLITMVKKDSGIVLNLKTGSSDIFSGSLPRVVSASGEKYEDGNTMFWAKGNTAMFVNDGIMYGHCIRMWPEEIDTDPCKEDDQRNRIDSIIKMHYSSDLGSIPEDQRVYAYDAVDLNADGTDEIFVGLVSPYFCGSGGCSWLLLSSEYSLMSNGTVSDFPFYISNASTGGYKDLYVRSNGTFHVLQFDGTGYPGNPSSEKEIQLFSDPEYTTAGVIRVLEQAYLKQCKF